MAGLREDKYQLLILPAKAEDDGIYSAPLCKEQIFFCLHKKHRFAKRKMPFYRRDEWGEYAFVSGYWFWHDLVKEKMPDSRFLMQTESYNFMELTANSIMPYFSTEAEGYAHIEADRVKIPD